MSITVGVFLLIKRHLGFPFYQPHQTVSKLLWNTEAKEMFVVFERIENIIVLLDGAILLTLK